MLQRSACNLCAFIFFIGLFTVMALGEPLATHRSFEACIFNGYFDDVLSLLDEGEVTKILFIVKY